jgi:hypothetical protein
MSISRKRAFWRWIMNIPARVVETIDGNSIPDLAAYLPR